MVAKTNGNHADATVLTPVAARTVALVGTASSSRELVHEQGQDVEIWGLNSSYDWMPRWDRWFEMHDRDRYYHIDGEHLARLQAMECPVLMAKHYEDIPQSVRYPVEEVTQGGRFRALFTSSIAYMIGLAIAEGFQEIRFCGIDMAMDSEYAYQRAACEYWLGVADALGIKVVIPQSSPIGKAPLYGQQAMEIGRSMIDWQDRVNAERLGKYEQIFTKLWQDMDTGRMELAAYEGARQIIDKMRRQDA